MLPTGTAEEPNIRWLHSQRILVGSLMTATLAVGVLTLLVIRQQQGQADGQIYLKRVAP